jgi:hypothetical protein
MDTVDCVWILQKSGSQVRRENVGQNRKIDLDMEDHPAETEQRAVNFGATNPDGEDVQNQRTHTYLPVYVCILAAAVKESL